MKGAFDVPAELEPLQSWVFAGLEATSDHIDAALVSDIPAVQKLCKHVERFRGKMLRPTLVLLSGSAAGIAETESPPEELVKVAAVVELVHMATLVHDDVLDEADARRGGPTINSQRGNETAVILGDYLIAAAFHLCASLPDQEPSRIVGRVAMELCAGELLQLENRDNVSLDESTYFEILEGKTAALVGACCRLGAVAAGAQDSVIESLDRFGRRVGSAFQVQDDVLDLTGDEAVVGKTLGRDLAKGKLTLPVIHHLGRVDTAGRESSLTALQSASEAGEASTESAAIVLEALRATDSILAAKAIATDLVTEAKAALHGVASSGAKQTLEMLADAVLTRDR